jgi:hypothetical protein
LYQRNLYVLAINLAQKAGLDASQQNVILRKFGDHLYSKQDYDTAMQQYLKAIDNTEPSQVIRKASMSVFDAFSMLTWPSVLRYAKDPQSDRIPRGVTRPPQGNIRSHYTTLKLLCETQRR